MPLTALRSATRTLRTALPRCTCSPSSSRFLATSPISRSDSSFSRPSPPPLPPQQQREFEELLRRVNAPASATEEEQHRFDQPERDEVHPDYRARPKPQFEGDRNPITGEVGGPKNEPLTHGDWAYGGKCTDF
ncbi:hypothetical protein JCM8097_009221 [Rhodosporidiobolus ruineniae]